MSRPRAEQAPAVVQGFPEPAGDAPGPGLIEGSLDPAAMVIFGASGDLTGRKLVPALYSLFCHGGLPEPFVILGCARSRFSDDAWRQKMRRAVAGHGGLDLTAWDRFAARLFYQPLVYDQPGTYRELRRRLQELEDGHGTGGNRVFNLAIPPGLYSEVVTLIGRAGMSAEGPGGSPWRRLVVEKPFGRDLASARELSQAIAASFQEHQVFRIDHYLAKETVQNVLMLRFANAIFEPIWNRNYIDQVTIIAAESLGVEHRAGYYERAGVLRDMFQNHMMQLLALAAMEPPPRYGAEPVRDEKTKLFRSLRPYPATNAGDYLVLGQYTAGLVDGRPVAAYRDEPGVDPASLTPTFALLKVMVDNWRWQGVPFFLVSGKRLARKVTRMLIQFKEVPHCFFREVLGEHITANRLVLGIQPDETISLTIQTKSPGARLGLRSVKMVFDYNADYSGPMLGAYEKALLNCMQGDQMLFWRQDGLELTWGLLDPVLHACERCQDRDQQLQPYAAGSWGPEAARRLLSLWPEAAE